VLRLQWQISRRQTLKGIATGIFTLVILSIPFVSAYSQAQDQTVQISGKEIVKRLARLEEGLKSLEKRIDGVEKSLNQRIDDLRQLMLWGFGITFAGIFALIGFVIWDRRTALAPAVNRMDRLEAALKEYAEKSPDLAEALRKAKLL
jgi:hypothetical protein